MLLDFVFLGLSVAIASAVLMFQAHIYRQFIQMPGFVAYQDEVKREVNYYAKVALIMFALWVIGWVLKEGSIGGFGVVLSFIFVFFSIGSAAKVMRLGNDHLPGDRTDNLPAE